MSFRGLAALNRFLGGEETTYLNKRTDDFDIATTQRWRMDRPPVLVYPRVETFYVPDSSVETVETQSINESDLSEDGLDLSEEYRITGLIWFTPGLTNTCNVDNFLSFWVRTALQTHGRASNHIVTTDLVGNALIKIADEALLARGRLDAKAIKLIWYKAILQVSGEAHVLDNEVRDRVLDCMGVNTCSVFQHLKNHSSYATETSCPCGHVYHRDFFLEIPTMTQLECLTTPARYPEARTPKCLRCKEKRKLLAIVSDPNNWILPIAWTGTGAHRNPSLRTIPKIINFGGIEYKIGYVSYSQTVPNMLRMTHEVSIQNIRGKWYLYDGIRDEKFRRFKEDIYSTNNARMSSLVYIKLDPTQQD